MKLFLIAIALFVVAAAAFSFAARTDFAARTGFASGTENPAIINAYVEPTKVVPGDEMLMEAKW